MSEENSNEKALKSGIWYTVGNFFVKSIGFITTPIFTRLLSKAEFGEYNNYTSWLGIATIFVTLNLDSTLISARYDYKKEFDQYILSMLSLSTLIAAVWFCIVNSFRVQFECFLGMDIVYINSMLLYLLFLSPINLFQARERYFFKYKITVISSILLAFVTASLSVFLVTNMQNRLMGRIFGMVIPSVLIGTLFYGFLVIKGKRGSISHWLYAIPVCLPCIPHVLSLTLLNSIDRIMIHRWCGEEATALYSLAYTCGTMINLLMISLNSAFAPWLGEKLTKNKYEEIKKISKIYIWIFFNLAMGVILVSPEVLLILGGKSYSEAVYVLAPISMGCMYQFLYTMFVDIEQFKRKTVGMAVASCIAALINIGLNCIFIPIYGYRAAAYTTLAGYLCLLVIHMFLVYKIGYGMVYDYRYMMMTAIGGTIITLSINFLYSRNVIRYVVIAVYIMLLLNVFYRNRKRVLELINIGNRKNKLD